MTRTVHVFAGPTIPPRRVRELLPEAVVHDPIRHRSLLDLRLAPGDAIALIDGVFLQSAPIRHKELVHTMEQGVDVWGASSMGALRAAELGPSGMRGVGLVHRLFALGVLDRDDEVAVVHADRDSAHRPLSIALVSVRVLARRARRQGLLSPASEVRLVDAAATLPFADRQANRMVQRAELSTDERSTFLRLADNPANDVKRQDAERLLRMLAADQSAGRGRADRENARPSARRRQPQTRYLASWIRESRSSEVEGVLVREVAALAVCQAFADDYPAWHRRLVLSAIAASAGTPLPPTAASLELEYAALTAARARGVLPRSGAELPPRCHRWLSLRERCLPPKRAALLVLVRSYRQPPDLTADDLALAALRGTKAFRMAQCHVAHTLRLNAETARRNGWHTPERIPEPRVRGYFAERWRVSADPDGFEFAVLDRGVPSRRAFTERARALLPYGVLGRVPPFSLD